MRKPLLAVLSGALAALSFPTPGWWPLAFVAWVPLLVALRDASIREGARLGMIAGATFFALVLRWIAPLSTLGLGALVIYLASYVALFGAAAAVLRGRSQLALPAVWGALEWTRGWAFGGFGWASLGYALPAQLAGLAAFGGVTLLSIGVMATSCALAHRRWALALIGPLALALGALRVPQTDGTVRVAAINAAIDPRGADVHSSLNAHAMLSDRVATERPALLVWPESALPVALDPPGAIPIRAMSLSRRVRELWGAPVLLGVPARVDETAFHNAGVLVDSERASIVVRKRRLVPLGEVDFAGLPRVLPGPLLRPGDGMSAPIAVAGARFGVLICFEDLFADDALSRARDADVLVVLTNDAWLGVAGAEQHAAVTTVRAIESGRAIVRAANRGVTTVLDPRGRALVTPTIGAGTVVAAVPRSTAPTMFARAPDLVPFAAWVVALGALALSGRRREVREVDGLL